MLTIPEIYHSLPNLGLGHLIDCTNSSRLNEAILLELSDHVRACVQEQKSFGTWADAVLKLLNALNDDEEDEWCSLKLDTIRACRLDKLLTDMLVPDGQSLFPDHYSAAEHLQRQWRSRFKQTYFDMDKTRYLEFGKRGQLRDVTFRKPELFSQGCWQTNNCDILSEAEGNLHFEAGE